MATRPERMDVLKGYLTTLDNDAWNTYSVKKIVSNLFLMFNKIETSCDWYTDEEKKEIVEMMLRVHSELTLYTRKYFRNYYCFYSPDLKTPLYIHSGMQIFKNEYALKVAKFEPSMKPLIMELLEEMNYYRLHERLTFFMKIHLSIEPRHIEYDDDDD
jgi:hypothetical protein